MIRGFASPPTVWHEKPSSATSILYLVCSFACDLTLSWTWECRSFRLARSVYRLIQMFLRNDGKFHSIVLLDTENQEKFYLYIIVSVTAGILLFLGLVIGRLLVSRHRAKRDAKFHANNEAVPNGFNDDISEIDADIDLTTPVPVPMQDTRFVFRLTSQIF